MLELIIKNACICNGKGGEPFCADVGISGDRIATVGKLDEVEANEELDATGLLLMPGFIDVHTHSDVIVLTAPDREEALLQGITTEIVSSCGIGVFPLFEAYESYEPLMRGILGKREGKTRQLKTCGEYLASLPRTGVNVAAQLPHSPLRAEVAGFRDIPLTGDLLERAKSMLRDNMEEGAVSLTTGLSYYPASFGDTAEIVTLCRELEKYDAPICAHLRSVLRTPNPKFDKRLELLEIGRQSGVRIHFSHYRTTPETVGRLDELFEPIEQGLSEDLRVTADFYPYPVGAGFCPVYLPLWAMEGGYSAIMSRLRNPPTRKRIEADLANSFPPIKHGVFLHAPRHPEYLGRTYDEVAAERKQSIEQMMIELLEDEDLELGFSHGTYTPAQEEALERDFPKILERPYYMTGSDAIPAHDFPHPRAFGAFSKQVKLALGSGMPPQILANRLSYAPAKLFQLRERGEIAENCFADLCVFAPNAVRDRATFSDPRKKAVGMTHVIVNGRFAIRDGMTTGERAGRPLRRAQ